MRSHYLYFRGLADETTALESCVVSTVLSVDSEAGEIAPSVEGFSKDCLGSSTFSSDHA